MSKLKPCPFCGGTHLIIQKDIDEQITLGDANPLYQVFCVNCYANVGWDESIASAIKSWNRRVISEKT